jgi:D-alanyl-lipoteichoic acid acyltransferase DltB (MBOAT superfamily)
LVGRLRRREEAIQESDHLPLGADGDGNSRRTADGSFRPQSFGLNVLFNSLSFALFFPLALAIHFLLPDRFRWMGLLVAGHVFYMSFVPWYIVLLWGAIGLDFTAALAIEGARTARARTCWLWVSVLGTAGLLGVFKYSGWALATARPLAALFHLPLPVLELAVPLGLSFHTFQSLAYVIEVHQRRYRAERHLGIYALYVLFYPQLVAGPIERPQGLLPQLRSYRNFDANMVASGLRRMAWGFFLKVAVADRLAPLADASFGTPGRISSPAAWVGLVAFAGQIYCDFAGYSEIARGCAEAMGISLARNFDRPWGGATPSEFWRRWHMSLSGWFRDYVYKPLGGSRVRAGRRDFNLLVTFAVSGIWHGAGLGFLVWGLWNGTLLVLERHFLPSGWTLRSILHRRVAHAATAFLVLLSWVFFRAPDFPHALAYFPSLFAGSTGSAPSLVQNLSSTRTELAMGLAGLAGVGIVHHLTEGDPACWIVARPVWIRWGAYWAVGGVLLLFGVFEGQRFVYFQF